jgi:1L-myo-inositol 1-phosphate cytidylyltransferase
MKCLIIAAGQGTRLRSVAPSKPLVRVRGTPLVEHIVRLARSGGATEFLVATGYQADPLEAFLRTLGERIGCPIDTVRNPDWDRPNGLSVLAAADRLDEPFVLLMSDHLFDPSILAGLIAGRRADAALTLAVDRDIDNPELDLDDATKVVSEGGRIVGIGKTITGYDAIDTGIFLATPALLEAIEASLAAGGGGSLSEGVQTLADAGRAFVFETAGKWWFDVDDAAALAKAEKSLPDFNDSSELSSSTFRSAAR